VKLKNMALTSLAVNACDIKLVNQVKSLRLPGRLRFSILGSSLPFATFFALLATLSPLPVFLFGIQD